jgi:hypothetical protein
LGETSFFENLLINKPQGTYNMIAALHSAALASGDVSLSLDDIFIVIYQLLETATGTLIPSVKAIATATAEFSQYIFNACGVLNDFSGNIGLVRAGLATRADNFSNRAGRELLNLGGGNDNYASEADGDVVDGGHDYDRVSYAGLSNGIEVTIEDPQLFSAAVSYTGKVRNVENIITFDYLHNVEQIVGTSFADSSEVSRLPEEALSLRGGAGLDSILVSDVDDGSRAASFTSVSVAVGKRSEGSHLRRNR